MKKKAPSAPARAEPGDDEIREYAYHLYEQSGRTDGQDFENWLEARACLQAGIPAHGAQTRLHRHLEARRLHPPANQAITVANPESRNLAL